MSYNREQWERRMQQRSDIPNYLTHLTRPSNDLTAIEVLLKILNEKKLIGSTTSTGFINGSSSAVCFQDAPLEGILQNLYYEKSYYNSLGSKDRYSAIGLQFFKPKVFNAGGRPCIYEKNEVAKRMLNKDDWWRIVSYDLYRQDAIIDWTHEREWRIKGDYTFKRSEVSVLLKDRTAYREFITLASDDILAEIAGITVLEMLI